MNPTTQPSEGAVRAAHAIEHQFDMNISPEDWVKLVRVIDHETGGGELVAALCQAERRLVDLRADETGPCPTLAKIRGVLSRHTSTQGKEGKL